jgi:diketogulonate reductase-like aldo/keto reductase
MPMVGLGCVQTDDHWRVEQAVTAAIGEGYRLIDTASVYGHEEAVGRALQAAAIPRQDIFLTTKVWNTDLGYDETLRAFDRSATALGVDYIDMYMIHFPLLRLRTESWRAIVRLQEEGRCRAIGVSNFAVRHIEEIVGETGQYPAVNQVEINPFLMQKKLHEWCRRKEIQIQTNTPLPRQRRRHRRFVAQLAEQYGRTPGQILIRWALQSDIAVLIRELEPNRIAELADVFSFEISLRDIDALNGLNENLRVGWNPDSAP